jgi:hydrogenase maturation protease
MRNHQTPRVAVVGIGNLLLEDEGVGIHAIRALEGLVPAQVGIQIVDGGTSPDILSSLSPPDKLVIVDAARGGGKPGTIYRFGPEEMSEGQGMVSLHEFNLGAALKTMKYRGIEPGQVVIVGIEPEEIDWGVELSSTLKREMPRLLEVVLNEIGLGRLETGGER